MLSQLTKTEDLLYPTIDNHVLFANHNMPCAICLKRHAVYDCNRGYFQPCWKCQEKGWTIKEGPAFKPKGNRFEIFIRRILGTEPR